MKKLLSIFLLSIILISCSPDRVLLNELTDKGTEESPIMYFEGALFNGLGVFCLFFVKDLRIQ